MDVEGGDADHAGAMGDRRLVRVGGDAANVVRSHLIRQRPRCLTFVVDRMRINLPCG